MTPRLNALALASIQAGVYICVSAIMAGHVLYTLVGWHGALLSLAVGSIVLWCLALIFARLSVTGRKVLIDIVHDYFGKGGAQVCGVAFAISLIGWFAIQLEIIVEGLRLIYPSAPILPLKVILGLLMTANVVKGMGWIAKFADASVPFLIAMMGYVIWMIYDPMHPFPKSEWTLNGVPLLIAFSITGIIDTPTYFCNSRSPRDAYIATSIVYLLILPFMAVIGLALGFYTGADSFISGIMNLGGNTWKALVMIFIVLSGWTTNNGNLYSASKALGSCIALREDRRTWLIGIVGVILACLGILHQFTNALEAMGIVVAALGAAILARFSKDCFHYSPSFTQEHKYYLCFIGIGVLVGALSQFKKITLLGYSFLDSFVVTLCMVFMYEGLKKCLHKSI